MTAKSPFSGMTTAEFKAKYAEAFIQIPKSLETVECDKIGKCLHQIEIPSPTIIDE